MRNSGQMIVGKTTSNNNRSSQDLSTMKRPQLFNKSTESVIQKKVGRMPWREKNKTHNYAKNLMRNVGFYSKPENLAKVYAKGDITGTNEIRFQVQLDEEKRKRKSPPRPATAASITPGVDWMNIPLYGDAHLRPRSSSLYLSGRSFAQPFNSNNELYYPLESNTIPPLEFRRQESKEVGILLQPRDVREPLPVPDKEYEKGKNMYRLQRKNPILTGVIPQDVIDMNLGIQHPYYSNMSVPLTLENAHPQDFLGLPLPPRKQLNPLSGDILTVPISEVRELGSKQRRVNYSSGGGIGNNGTDVSRNSGSGGGGDKFSQTGGPDGTSSSAIDQQDGSGGNNNHDSAHDSPGDEGGKDGSGGGGGGGGGGGRRGSAIEATLAPAHLHEDYTRRYLAKNTSLKTKQVRDLYDQIFYHLENYASCEIPTHWQSTKHSQLIERLHEERETTAAKTGLLQEKSRELLHEKKLLEQAVIKRKSKEELASLSALDRMKIKTEEDRKIAQWETSYNGVDRELNDALAQVRLGLLALNDIKMITKEACLLRINKLTEALRHARNGNHIRLLIREFLILNCQDLQERLNNNLVQVDLSSDMKELLIHYCRLELQITDLEVILSKLRRQYFGFTDHPSAVKPRQSLSQSYLDHHSQYTNQQNQNQMMMSLTDRQSGLSPSPKNNQLTIKNVPQIGGSTTPFGGSSLLSPGSLNMSPSPQKQLHMMSNLNQSQTNLNNQFGNGPTIMVSSVDTQKMGRETQHQNIQNNSSIMNYNGINGGPESSPPLLNRPGKSGEFGQNLVSPRSGNPNNAKERMVDGASMSPFNFPNGPNPNDKNVVLGRQFNRQMNSYNQNQNMNNNNTSRMNQTNLGPSQDPGHETSPFNLRNTNYANYRGGGGGNGLNESHRKSLAGTGICISNSPKRGGGIGLTGGPNISRKVTRKSFANAIRQDAASHPSVRAGSLLRNLEEPTARTMREINIVNREAKRRAVRGLKNMNGTNNSNRNSRSNSLASNRSSGSISPSLSPSRRSSIKDSSPSPPRSRTGSRQGLASRGGQSSRGGMGSAESGEFGSLSVTQQRAHRQKILNKLRSEAAQDSSPIHYTGNGNEGFFSPKSRMSSPGPDFSKIHGNNNMNNNISLMGNLNSMNSNYHQSLKRLAASTKIFERVGPFDQDHKNFLREQINFLKDRLIELYQAKDEMKNHFATEIFKLETTNESRPLNPKPGSRAHGYQCLALLTNKDFADRAFANLLEQEEENDDKKPTQGPFLVTNDSLGDLRALNKHRPKNGGVEIKISTECNTRYG